MSEKKSKGVALILATLFGPFGFDKLYVGANSLFIAQFLCTIFVIGLLFSGPYAFISILTLSLTILFGINTFLYPKVEWMDTTIFDIVVACIVFFGLILLPSVFKTPFAIVIGLLILAIVLIIFFNWKKIKSPVLTPMPSELSRNTKRKRKN